MWSTLEKAIEHYPYRRAHFLSQEYLFAWQPADKTEALRILSSSRYLRDLYEVLVNTPSVAQYWPTQPSFKYVGRPSEVFVKCGDERRISDEVDSIGKLGEKRIPIPRIYDVFETPDHIKEDFEAAGLKIGKIIIEDFLYSVSLGHALVDHRINVERMASMTIDVLSQLHEFGMHGELKHQHIRACVSKEDALSKLSYVPNNCSKDITLSSIHFIDLETFNLSDDKAHNKQTDLNFLDNTLNDYIGKLDALKPEVLKSITPLSSSEYTARKNRFMEIIRTDYFNFVSIPIRAGLLNTKKFRGLRKIPPKTSS